MGKSIISKSRYKWGNNMFCFIMFVLVAISLPEKAAGHNVDDPKINLNLQNTTLKNVIWAIEKQSNIMFVYNSDDAEAVKIPSLQVQNKSVMEVLNICLKNTPLNYIVQNGVITLSKKANAPNTVVQTPPKKIKITGYIIDDDRLPLYGVTISEVGASNVVVSKKDGDYSIEVTPRENLKLLYSYIGMKPQTVTVGLRTNIDIKLESTSAQLNEIVVTGYGNVVKESYTGSATVIGSKELDARPIATFDEALRGISPGTIVAGVGQPGEATSVRLRGIGSMSAGNQPLYVIDGVVWDQDNTSGNENSPSNPMTTLNPSDIASITILKDAASASLYGSQGANGVIVVTTKQGVSGDKIKYTLSVQAGASMLFPGCKPELVNGRQYAELWTEGNFHGLIYTEAGSNNYIDVLKNLYSDKVNHEYKDKNYYEWNKIAQQNFNIYYKIPKADGTYHNYDFFGADATMLPNVDWFDKITRLAPFQKYNLSISGGGKLAKYYLSLEYFDQEGIIVNSQLKRYSTRFNLSADDKKHFINWGANVMLSNSMQTGPANQGQGYNMPQYAAIQLPPVVPVYLDDGSYNFNFPNNLLNTTHNPLASALENIRERPLINISTSGWIQFNLLKWAKLKSTLSNYYLYSRRHEYFDKDFGSGISTSGSLTERDSRRNKLTSTNMLFLEHTINNRHRFNGTVGIEYVDLNNEDNSINVNGFMVDELPYLSVGSEVASWSGDGYAYSMFSIISKADYSYRYRYFLSGSFRQDASSRLAPGHRTGNFWSVSGAWRITNEPWMKEVRKIANSIKLKASYGINGTLPQVYYNWRPLFTGAAKYMNDHALYSSFQAATELTWEKNKVYNIGLETGFLENRFKISAEYYNRKTSDLLQNLPVSRTSGYSTMLMNTSAGINNKGLEIDVNANIIDAKIKWDVNWNIATLKSKYYGLANDDIGTQIMRNGESVYAWFVYEYVGVDSETGKALYQNYDKDGNKSGVSSTTSTATDRRVVGKGLPSVTGGFTSTLSYRNWEVKALFTYATGFQIYDAARSSILRTDGYGNYSIEAEMMDRWTPDHPDAQNIIRLNTRTSTAVVSTRNLFKGDYLKLKNVRLQYTFPGKTFRTLGITGLSFFASAENLWVLTKLNDYDPEMQLDGYRYADRYPTATTFTAGATINF